MKRAHLSNPREVIHAFESIISETFSVGRYENDNDLNAIFLMHPAFGVRPCIMNPRKGLETWIKRCNVKQDEDLRKQTESWGDKVDVSDKYSAYHSDFIGMLTKFRSMRDRYFVCINLEKHLIVLLNIDTLPVHSATYCVGPKTKEFENSQIEKMLKQNIIEPALNECVAPIVIALKDDGPLRLCIDPRELTAETKRDFYPIFRMDEWIEWIGETTGFSALDANNGYWQFWIGKPDCNKTASALHRGLNSFIRKAHGLRYSPGPFPRIMDVILFTVKWQFALV